jgi:hypothetical protein
MFFVKIINAAAAFPCFVVVVNDYIVRYNCPIVGSMSSLLQKTNNVQKRKPLGLARTHMLVFSTVGRFPSVEKALTFILGIRRAVQEIDQILATGFVTSTVWVLGVLILDSLVAVNVYILHSSTLIAVFPFVHEEWVVIRSFLFQVERLSMF